VSDPSDGQPMDLSGMNGRNWIVEGLRFASADSISLSSIMSRIRSRKGPKSSPTCRHPVGCSDKVGQPVPRAVSIWCISLVKISVPASMTSAVRPHPRGESDASAPPARRRDGESERVAGRCFSAIP